MEQIRIFLVDDEPMAIRHIKRVLGEEQETYQIVGTAENGRQVLEKLEACRPDMILADVCMPVMDGLELAGAVKEHYPEIKVILLTSYKDFSFVQQGLALGIAGYMIKNEITKEQVDSEIKRLFLQSKMEKEKNRTYFEKNLLNFLNHGEKSIVTFTAPEGCAISYAVISIFRKTPIRLSEMEEKEFRLDENQIETIVHSENMKCRAAVKVSSVSYCLIFYVRNLLSERQQQEQLCAVAGQIEGFLKEQKEEYVLLVSPANLTFDEIPSCFQRQRVWERYTHMLNKGHVWYSWEYEKEKNMGQQVDIWKWMEEIVDPVNREWKLDTAVEKLRRYRDTMPAETFLHIAKLLYQELLAKRKESCLSTNELEKRIKYDFQNAEGLENWLSEEIKKTNRESETEGAQSYSEYIKGALDYIHENYEKQISLEDISRYIGISESHLRRSFRRETGMTVVDYITRYRIEKAKRLLETGQYVIGEIYEKVGFSTSQYFSIVFKRYEKISPGQYQKKWSSQRE